MLINGIIADQICDGCDHIRLNHIRNMNDKIKENELQTTIGSAYGKELILDLHGCEVTKFTRSNIKQFCIELCELINMERCDLYFWDDIGVPEEDQQTNPKTKGTSAVQFIITSTIVIHTLDLMKTAYINIFSCKEFDIEKATKFTVKWFDSSEWTVNVITRH